MGKWSASLPSVSDQSAEKYAEGAVYWVRAAMVSYRLSDKYNALRSVRIAAAYVRAWRKSQDDQGERIEVQAWKDRDTRALLRQAISSVLLADDDGIYCPAVNLRYAECALRIVGKRLMKEV